ncbi:MAG: hypothetical protein ACFB2X_01530 [Rivularia sp. (in: cyanobacteria)]
MSAKSFTFISSYRYDAVYKLIWHCAENMSYQDFNQAWNK